jgi:hypothetical protein
VLLTRQFIVVILLAQVTLLLKQPINAADDANAEIRYLLVRRAGSPEKNYYELSRTARLLEPQLFNDEFFKQYRGGKPKGIGLDIITDSTIRYGVYQAWKVRITRTADSIKEPTSTKESGYVLTYPRNPDWIFCAKRYNVLSSSTRDRTVIYTDFQNGSSHLLRHR